MPGRAGQEVVGEPCGEVVRDLRGQESCREPPGDGGGEAGGFLRGQDEAGVYPAQGGEYGDGSGVGVGERDRCLRLGLNGLRHRFLRGRERGCHRNGGLLAGPTRLRRLGRSVRIRIQVRIAAGDVVKVRPGTDLSGGRSLAAALQVSGCFKLLSAREIRISPSSKCRHRAVMVTDEPSGSEEMYAATPTVTALPRRWARALEITVKSAVSRVRTWITPEVGAPASARRGALDFGSAIGKGLFFLIGQALVRDCRPGRGPYLFAVVAANVAVHIPRLQADHSDG